MAWEHAIPLIAAGSGAAWSQLAAWRAGYRRPGFTLRALLGGCAAFGLALAAYDAAALFGLQVRWDALSGGGPSALLAAAAIGFFEEGAKLAGILLVIDRRLRPRAIAATGVGVAAGFSALEALLVLDGETSALALARAALGPVAHALLAVPLALGVVRDPAAEGARSPSRSRSRRRPCCTARETSPSPRPGSESRATPPRWRRRRSSSSSGNERVRSNGGPCVRPGEDRSPDHRREAGFASKGFMPTSPPPVNPCPAPSPPGALPEGGSRRSVPVTPRRGWSKVRIAPATSW